MTKLLLIFVVACLLILAGLAIYDSYKSVSPSQGEEGDVEQETTT